MTFQIDPTIVVSFLLVMTRLVATMTVAPPFAGGLLPLQVRVAIAAGVSLVVTPLQPDLVPLEAGPLILALVYQVVVGAVFGFLIQLLLAAPMAAGSLLDTLAGLSAASLFDPTINSSSSPGARLNQMVTTVVLVSIDGHLMIVRGVIRSYEAAPLSGLRVEGLGRTLPIGAGQMLLAAVEIALPLLVALLMVETMLALAARAAPRLNVMVVGFAVKGLVFLLGFSLVLPLVVNAAAALLDRSLRWGLSVAGA